MSVGLIIALLVILTFVFILAGIPVYVPCCLPARSAWLRLA